MKTGKGRHPVQYPEVLTADESARLMAQVEAEGCPRNHALVALMLGTGLRASEVLSLRDQNLEVDRGRLWVRQGKGRKDRALWLSPDVLFLLRRWLAVRGPGGPPSGVHGPPSGDAFIFTKLNSRQPMGGRWLRYLISDLARRAGISKRVHPHTLRHTFASALLRQEKSVFLVSRALGHKNLTTTMVYLHIEDHELEAAMKRLEVVNANHEQNTL